MAPGLGLGAEGWGGWLGLGLGSQAAAGGESWCAFWIGIFRMI